MAVVTVVDANLWAITDDNGHFSIRNVQAGKHPVNVRLKGIIILNRHPVFELILIIDC